MVKRVKRMKTKLLCILHFTPPTHGASKVGDIIKGSRVINDKFICKYIKIKSSDTIEDSGKVNLKKFYYLVELWIKVLWSLLTFRPDKLYFTASVRGIAFYRDLSISVLWKIYSFFTSLDIYYHYHTKGIEKFVVSSASALKLTNFFTKGVSIILLSPLLKNDFAKVSTYDNILFLPNGVENNYSNEEFERYIIDKKFEKINILYLSNMIKSKGYLEVIKLAKIYKKKNYHYHFAGGWQDKNDEKEFYNFIEDNKLENIVTFHGFVHGKRKKELFESASMFIFPTRYDNEAFPLAILEALSYGLPVLTTNEGSIPFMVDNKSGIVVDNLNNLSEAFEEIIEKFINVDTAKYCRKRYLENFSIKQFEDNLIKVLKQ